jgi:peptide/nickel transport system permease protein
MIRFTVHRLARGALVMLLVSFIVMGLMALTPGSAASAILGDAATPESVDALNQKLGVDRPFIVQWLSWLGGAVRGDFGTSPISNLDVLQSILDRLPVTIEIAILGQLLALLIAVPLAILAARREDGAVDRMANSFTSVLLSIPAFVAAPILVLIFAIHLNWFPVVGWVPLTENPVENLRSAFLPAVCVALIEVSVLQRVFRAELGTTLKEDFVASARAKGMPGHYVMVRHALRPSSFSLLTVATIGFGRLLGGTVIVESFFSLPGIGQFVSTAVNTRDLITVQGTVVFVAIVYVTLNALVDVAYGAMDPRIRLARTPS